jgi:hypothetical protein
MPSPKGDVIFDHRHNADAGRNRPRRRRCMPVPCRCWAPGQAYRCRAYRCPSLPLLARPGHPGPVAGPPVRRGAASRTRRPAPVPLAGTETVPAPAPRHVRPLRRRLQPRARESFAELVEQSLLTNGLPLLRRILDQGSPLIEAGLLAPDGLRAAIAELEGGPYSEDPRSKLVEVITLDQAARAFLP